MPSAGLLPLVIFFTALNLVQSKHLHVETEDNSEADPMPKEQVEGVLSVISKEARENYESLNKAVSTQNSNIIRIGEDDHKCSVRLLINHGFPKFLWP